MFLHPIIYSDFVKNTQKETNKTRATPLQPTIALEKRKLTFLNVEIFNKVSNHAVRKRLTEKQQQLS